MKLLLLHPSKQVRPVLAIPLADLDLLVVEQGALADSIARRSSQTKEADQRHLSYPSHHADAIMVLSVLSNEETTKKSGRAISYSHYWKRIPS